MSTPDLAEARRMLDSATDALAAARADLAAKVSSGKGYTAESLAENVNEIARWEGSFAAIERAVRFLDYVDRSETPVNGTLADVLTKMVLTGADDQWSGRTNDVKRARYDGLCGQVERLLDF
jgi:hypothetical protein